MNYDLEEEEDDNLKDRFLAFCLGDEDYALPIACITEIVGLQKIAALPDMPDFIRGVINLRGRVIPVMDVRLRFRMNERPYDERTCLIVVDVQDCTLGLVVDTVNEVVNIPEDLISTPQQLARQEKARYIHGIGKTGDGVKILLDVEKLLDLKEQTELQKIAV